MKTTKFTFKILLHFIMSFLLYILFVELYFQASEYFVADSLCNEITGDCNPYGNILKGFSRTAIFKILLSIILFVSIYLPVYLLIFKKTKKVVLTVLLIYTSFFVMNVSTAILLEKMYSHKLISEYALESGKKYDAYIKENFNVYAGLSMVSWDYKIRDKAFLFHNFDYYKRLITENPSHEVLFTEHSFAPDINKYQQILNYLKFEKINIESLKVRTKFELIKLELDENYRIIRIDLRTHNISLRGRGTSPMEFVPVSKSDFEQINVGMTRDEISTILRSKGSEGKNFYRYKGEKKWMGGFIL